MISISGIRGKIPGSFTPELVCAFARAYARALPSGPIVISRDSRASSSILKKAVINALTDDGRDVYDADLNTLPTTQYCIPLLHGAGGIDITASHNPVAWNGLKLFGPDGVYIDQEKLDTLITRVLKGENKSTRTHAKGWVRSVQTKVNRLHRESLIPMIFPGKRLRVAVDAVNGAGSYIIPQFLKDCGCDVVPLATDPTQPFPHTPEPTPKNLTWTLRKCAKISCDFGIVVDPDADRLLFIDETGSLLSEEMSLPLALQECIAQGRQGSIVVNMSTSRMIEDIARAHRCTVHRSAVGELNVIDVMKRENAFFGGEGNGGVIDPSHHYGRDSLIGILYVLNLIRRTDKPLSHLIIELPHYEMMKEKVTVHDRNSLPQIYASIKKTYPQGKFNEIDGLRIDFDDAWVHIRPSNTEPIVRVIAEAHSTKEVQKYITSVTQILKANE